MDHRILQPALRLASHLLRIPFNLPFWHALLFSGVRDTSDIIYSGKKSRRCYEYTDARDTLTPEEEARTNQALVQLADRIKFRSVRKEDANKGSAGFTNKKCGHVAMINLTPSALEADGRLTGLQDPRLRTWTSSRLAQTLVHEVAHAVKMLTRPPGLYFFPGSLIAEGEWKQHLSWKHHDLNLRNSLTTIPTRRL